MELLGFGSIVIRPKRPFVDWANQIARQNKNAVAEITEEEARRRGTVYLIPEPTTAAEAMEYAKRHWEKIFDHELEGQWDDEGDLWPRHRTWEMFLEWFDVEVHREIVDLTGNTYPTFFGNESPMRA